LTGSSTLRWLRIRPEGLERAQRLYRRGL